MLRKQHRLKPLMLVEVPSDSSLCGLTVCTNGSFLPDIRGKEPKPGVTLPSRFPLLAPKGSARNATVCRGLAFKTSTSTSTKPDVNPQVLKVLGVGRRNEKPGQDGEAILMKPHPPKGNSGPTKPVIVQAVAPARKLKESSPDLTVEGEVVRRCLSGRFPPAPPSSPSSPVLQPTPPPKAMTPVLLARRMRAIRMNPCY